jgi:DNA-binding PucR family transcriptional regulator
MVPKPPLPVDDFKKAAYLDWLCTPVKEREPRTAGALADQLGVHRNSLIKWREEPDFLKAWEKQYRRTVGNPERAQAIMDTLFKTATDPDDPKHVAAAKQYLEAIDAVKPQQVNIQVNGSAKDLSDEQLNELIAERAATEAISRGLRAVNE